ncbi:hypothetical protein [Prosthecobacter sp.]|uniref:hypothetical protein n=1 Tax=Prosthecobacter sp. TaxID=1965333 RepID=UPI0025D95AF8|nr:hypothetical protein [Prosthecobacter sp.]
MFALVIAMAFLVSGPAQSLAKQSVQRSKPVAAPPLKESAGSVTAPLLTTAAAVSAPARRLLPVTSGQTDAQGFDVVVWPEGRPHYEGEPVVARVTTGSDNRKLHLEVNQMGEFPRVQVTPGENMNVRLQFQTSKPGMPVALTAQDGGTLGEAKMSQRVMLDDQRSVTFDFAASANVGTHRVTVVTPAGEVKTLDFWVGEPNTMRTTAQR